MSAYKCRSFIFFFEKFWTIELYQTNLSQSISISMMLSLGLNEFPISLDSVSFSATCSHTSTYLHIQDTFVSPDYSFCRLIESTSNHCLFMRDSSPVRWESRAMVAHTDDLIKSDIQRAKTKWPNSINTIMSLASLFQSHLASYDVVAHVHGTVNSPSWASLLY